MSRASGELSSSNISEQNPREDISQGGPDGGRLEFPYVEAEEVARLRATYDETQTNDDYCHWFIALSVCAAQARAPIDPATGRRIIWFAKRAVQYKDPILRITENEALNTAQTYEHLLELERTSGLLWTEERRAIRRRSSAEERATEKRAARKSRKDSGAESPPHLRSEPHPSQSHPPLLLLPPPGVRSEAGNLFTQRCRRPV